MGSQSDNWKSRYKSLKFKLFNTIVESNNMYVYLLLNNSPHMDASLCSFPQHYELNLKLNIYGHIQNITIFIKIKNNTDGQGSPALCRF